MKLHNIFLLSLLSSTPALAYIDNIHIYCPAQVHCENGHCYPLPVNASTKNFVEFGEPNLDIREGNYKLVAAIDGFGIENYENVNCSYNSKIWPNYHKYPVLTSKIYLIADTGPFDNGWQIDPVSGNHICDPYPSIKACPFKIPEK